MSADFGLQVHNLSKTYGKGLLASGRHYALRDVKLAVPRGSVWAVVGGNGAGKTTLLHCLVGLLRPSYGRVALLAPDQSPRAARQHLGFLPELFVAPGQLNVREYLRCCGTLMGMAPQTLQVQMDRVLQRLGLAQSLLHGPALVVWDEPSSGLDPLGRKLLVDLLAAEQASGTTVILATHALAEVQRSCTGMTILRHGQVVAHGTLAQLCHDFGQPDAEGVFLAASQRAEGAFYAGG